MADDNVNIIQILQDRIAELQRQRQTRKKELELQLRASLAVIDVALNELKDLLVQVGGPVLEKIELSPEVTSRMSLPAQRRSAGAQTLVPPIKDDQGRVPLEAMAPANVLKNALRHKR